MKTVPLVSNSIIWIVSFEYDISKSGKIWPSYGRNFWGLKNYLLSDPSKNIVWGGDRVKFRTQLLNPVVFSIEFCQWEKLQ